MPKQNRPDRFYRQYSNIFYFTLEQLNIVKLRLIRTHYTDPFKLFSSYATTYFSQLLSFWSRQIPGSQIFPTGFYADVSVRKHKSRRQFNLQTDSSLLDCKRKQTSNYLFTFERTNRSLLAFLGSCTLYLMVWKNSTDIISAALQHDVGWLQVKKTQDYHLCYSLLRTVSLKHHFIRPQLLSIKPHKSEVFDNPPLCRSPSANQLYFETKGASDLVEVDVQSRPCWQLMDLSFRALSSSPCQGPPPEGVTEAQGPVSVWAWNQTPLIYLVAEIHTNAEETRTAFHSTGATCWMEEWKASGLVQALMHMQGLVMQD